MPTRRRYLGLVSSALTVSVAGCSDGASTDTESSPTSTDETTTPVQEGTSETKNATKQSAYTELYKDLVDSVVLIRAPGGSLGSGFILRDGTVTTNAHVVRDAEHVGVQFSQGLSVDAEVLGADVLSDLAVVQPTERPDYAKPLSLAESEPPVGRQVAVVGSPFGLSGSLSSGIVSGTNRLVPNPRAQFLLPNAIQTDAPVNPGNSGGPLTDLEGTVLGVVNSGGGDNIAFAISAAMVQRVVPALISDGNYVHPYLGVRLTDVTEIVARANDLQKPRGLLVVETAEGSPAADVLQASDSTEQVAGFEVPVGGDVILAVDGTQISTRQDFLSYLFLQTSPGDTVSLKIRRNGNRQTVQVDLAAREASGN